MEYVDVVRNVSQAYWLALLENDDAARAVVHHLGEAYGLPEHAVDSMIENISRQPMSEWLAQRSAAA